LHSAPEGNTHRLKLASENGRQTPIPPPSISEANEILGGAKRGANEIGFWPRGGQNHEVAGIERERMSPGDGWTMCA